MVRRRGRKRSRQSASEKTAVVAPVCEAERKKLLEKAAKLPDGEQAVLRMLSAAYEDVATSTFLKCLNDCGIGDGNRQFDRNRLDTLLASFAKAGLAERIKGRTRIARAVAEPLTRELAAEADFAKVAKAIETHLPKVNQYARHGDSLFRGPEQALRFLRLALYGRDASAFRRYFNGCMGQCFVPFGSYTAAIRSVWWNPYDPAWLEELPASMRDSVLETLLSDSNADAGECPAEALALLERLASGGEGEVSYSLMSVYAWRLLETGSIDALERLATGCFPNIGHGGPFHGHLFEGVAHFLRGRDEDALEAFERALAQKKKDLNKRKVWFETAAGAFYLLTLLRLDDPKRLREGKSYIAALTKKKVRSTVNMYLERVFDLRLGDREKAEDIENWTFYLHPEYSDPFSRLIGFLTFFWVTGEIPERVARQLKLMPQAARDRGLRWLAAESATLIDRAGLKVKGKGLSEAKAFYDETGLQPMVDVVRPQAAWEAALEAMTRFIDAPEADTGTDTGGDTRIIWLFRHEEFEEYGYKDVSFNIEPREQKRNKKGWSKGRKVALKRLASERETLPCLTPEDLKVCDAIEWRIDYGYSRYYGGRTVYEFNMPRALRALAGHPRLFLADSPDTPVEIVEGRPELRVEEAKGELRVRMVPAIHSDAEVSVWRDSPTRFTVFFPEEGHRKLAGMLGEEGIRVPASARDGCWRRSPPSPR